MPKTMIFMPFVPLAQVFAPGVATFSIALIPLMLVQAVLPTAAFAQATKISTPALQSEVVTADLQNPWALAFLPGGRFLITERTGSLRIIEANGVQRPSIANLPTIAVGGQGGLLDVVLDSDFAANRTLYFCFSEPVATGKANSTALARATLSADERQLTSVKVIFSQKPKVVSSAHFGCRIVEGRTPGLNGPPDGTLFLTLGERYSQKDDAQTLNNHHGKVVRIRKDGTVPADNPFVNTPGALPEIWSYGHRNLQGATLSPRGVLWTHEHGPQGGDEINLPQPGVNHGWPVITYGEEYGGGPIGAGITEKAGMAQPLHYWVPSIAPSGMAFITSERYGKAFQGNLLVGSLKFGYVDRIELAQPFEGKVTQESRLLDKVGRVRDVRQGPDGLMYVLTDGGSGKLIRVLPGGVGQR